jgi:hypothetical protein
MILLYLAQFTNQRENRQFTFSVVRRFTRVDDPPARFLIDRDIFSRADLLCELDRNDVYLRSTDESPPLLKCRDCAETNRGLVVKEEDVLEWLRNDRPVDKLPPFYRREDL